MSRSGSWWFTTAGFCDVTLAVCDPPAPQPRDPRVLPASFRRLGHATLACSRPLFALLAVLSAQPRVEGLGREHSRRCAAARARQRVRALGRPQYANAQRASTTTAQRENITRSPRRLYARWPFRTSGEKSVSYERWSFEASSKVSRPPPCGSTSSSANRTRRTDLHLRVCADCAL